MQRIVILAKAPEPGKVKTRMQPTLSPDACAALAKQLLEAVLSGVAPLLRARQIDEVVLACAPGIEHAFFQAMEEKYSCKRIAQSSGDLGSRLEAIATAYLQSADDRLILLGSDSPSVPQAYFLEALQALARGQTVVGPCTDGGYYLLGLHGPFRQMGIFAPEISWGTHQVLPETLRRLAAAQISVHLLQPWFDIDRPEDLRHFLADWESNGKLN